MIVSPDTYLYLPDGTYHWTPERVQQAWESAREAFDAHLQRDNPSKVVLLMGVPAAGKSTWLAEHRCAGVVYFDATFAMPQWREPWIKKALAADLPLGVEIVWLDTPLAVCIERNAARPTDRQVPEDTMRAMHDKIMSSPPTEAEGATITIITPKEAPHG
jgi:predicted kinase